MWVKTLFWGAIQLVRKEKKRKEMYINSKKQTV
jgi:hypothetical protein